MNVYTQFCGIAVMLVLLIFYNYNNQLKLDIGKAFERLMYCSLIGQCLDILSIVALANLNEWGTFLVKLLCRLYLVSMILLMTNSLIYLFYDIFDDVKLRRKNINRIITLTILGSLLVFILPIGLYSDTKNGIYYTMDASVVTTYIFCGVMMLTIFYYAITKKKSLNPERSMAIRVWIALWLISSVIQFLKNDLLIVSFAGAIGVLIVYLKMENPEMVTDKRTGMLNKSGLEKYINDLFNNEKEFGIVICNYERSFSRISNPKVKLSILKEIIGFFKELKGVKAFRISDDEMILVFEDNFNIHRVINKIEVRFRSTWGSNDSIEIIPYIMSLKKAYEMEDLNEILYMIRYVKIHHSEYIEKRFIEIDDNIIAGIRKELAMEKEVKCAIEEDRIEVFCQPIFSNIENRYTTGEVLVRIRKREGGYIPPGDFIELIESNGDIIQVGMIIFEKACQFINKNGLKEYGIDYLEVNLSVVQCADKRLAKDYIRIMEKYNINPGLINLEITESATMESKRTLLSNMKILMEHGVHFSLDDFGTGQSNLNYIAEMPVSIVKFDKSMIQGYFEDDKTKFILDAAIQMITGLGLDIVAEGVETKEQYETLRNKGITYIQGYYFSKPLPMEDFYEVIKESKEK